MSMGNRKKKQTPRFQPEVVWVTKAVAGHPQTLRILNRLEDVDINIIDEVRLLKKPGHLGEAKRQMILTAHRGRAFKPCQGIGPGHICCNYRVIDLISGCPMDCSYCILQSYLANNPITTVYVNIESILEELGSFLSSHPQHKFRIGTGELADSLALDPITDFASILIPFFASRPNAVLELKTKTDIVDHLLDLRHKGHTVISWSVNTPQLIASDERDTTTLDERLAAATKAASAGYGLGFHFDPIIVSKGTSEEIAVYMEVIDRIFEAVDPQRIAWVSLGLLRYPPELAELARRRFPDTRIFSGELVPTTDKVRYPRFIRQEVYRPLWDRLSSRLPTNKLYLCMETKAVWESIDPAITSSAGIENRLCGICAPG